MADEKKTLPGYYAVIPADVRYDNRLSAAEKLMYAEISALAQSNGCCWAKTKYFCDLFDVADSTVRRWITELQKYGYIWTEIVTKNGMVSGRRIYLTCSLPASAQKSADVRPKMSAPPAQKSADKNNTSISNNNTPPTPPEGGSATDELFDQFWHEYPKKADKQKARRAWKKIKHVEKQFPAIMNALQSQKQSVQWTKDKGQYIPLPSTWLNGERWTDESVPAAAPAESQPQRREVHRKL